MKPLIMYSIYEYLTKIDTFCDITNLNLLYVNIDPFTGFKTQRSKQKTGNLIRQNSHPDAGHSPSQDKAAHIGEACSDNGYADGRGKSRICRIPSAAQTSHIDDLGYLKQHNKNDYANNIHSHCHNFFLCKKQAVQAFPKTEIDDCKGNGYSQTDTPADTTVCLRLVRQLFPKTSSD